MRNMYRQRMLALGGVVGIFLMLAGCGGMATKTTEVISSYAIYDIKPQPGVNAVQISEAIKKALRENMSRVNLVSGIPPSPLPEQPGRFKLLDPMKASNVAALAAVSGQTFQKMPVCDNAIITATSQDSALSKYGEKTTFFLCVLPYQGGYHLDLYVTFYRRSGGFSSETMGATLMRPFVGDSSQFIPRIVNAIVSSVEQAGANTSLVEQYP